MVTLSKAKGLTRCFAPLSMTHRAGISARLYEVGPREIGTHAGSAGRARVASRLLQGSHAFGLMFWLWENRLLGSYRRFTSDRRW